MKLFQYNESGDTKIGLIWEGNTICFSEFLDDHTDLWPNYLGNDDDPLYNLILLDFFTAERIKQINDLLSEISVNFYFIHGDIQYLTPSISPGRIIAIGRNYAKHAHELNNPVPDKLLFFEKTKTTLLAHNKTVVVPSWIEGRVDHEIELAFILRKGGNQISKEDAMSCVAGYTIFNDITARDLQSEAKKQGHPWFKSKNPDTFGPMGPYFVPEHFIQDPHDLDLELKVNGETRQIGNTKDMIFKIPDIISILSTYLTLLPGDVIITGTPEGVSPLQDGDVMEASITHLGTLRNRVTFQQ